jgi:hypothetical protein
MSEAVVYPPLGPLSSDEVPGVRAHDQIVIPAHHLLNERDGRIAP